MSRSDGWALALGALVLAACGSSAPLATPTATATTDPARSIESAAPQSTTPLPVSFLPGAGVVAEAGFADWQGQRVGLIANQASVVDGTHTADLFAASDVVDLVALFSPEHGLRGDRAAGEWVPDEIDPITGRTVHSLYGETRSPQPAALEDLDVLFYDLQDVGARYYTYISTMGLAMQAAAAHDVEFVVLDRPNPLGPQVAGNVLAEGAESFVGMYPIPDLYGLSAGELAQAIVGEEWLDGLGSLRLTVIPYEHDAANLSWPESAGWVPPSPAIGSIETARLYPATVLFEATSLSYGRGTDTPFEVIGAPWIDERELARTLTDLGLAGVSFEPIRFTPRAEPAVEIAHAGVEVGGVRLRLTDEEQFHPATTGVQVLAAVHELAPEDIIDRPEWLRRLSGSSALGDHLREGRPISTLIGSWDEPLATYEQTIRPYRIYPPAAR
ncbi:MAG: DUF1343 domain-containing protein [Acidimicrobiales bacterium]|nr:DUF1343 domain-containing protein [Acidimicrobiales bacterium]